MSWNHRTIGSGVSAFLEALRIVGVPIEEGEHGIVFTTPDGRQMVAEEYLSVDDGDCDGTSEYSCVVYELGQRPMLYTRVLDSGMNGEDYPAVRDDTGNLPYTFDYCINDGTFTILEEDFEWPDDDDEDYDPGLEEDLEGDVF
jgi:hypothetical protein